KAVIGLYCDDAIWLNVQPPLVSVAKIHRNVNVLGRPEALRQDERLGLRPVGPDSASEAHDSGDVAHSSFSGSRWRVDPAVLECQSCEQLRRLRECGPVQRGSALNGPESVFGGYRYRALSCDAQPPDAAGAYVDQDIDSPTRPELRRKSERCRLGARRANFSLEMNDPADKANGGLPEEATEFGPTGLELERGEGCRRQRERRSVERGEARGVGVRSSGDHLSHAGGSYVELSAGGVAHVHRDVDLLRRTEHVR